MRRWKLTDVQSFRIVARTILVLCLTVGVVASTARLSATEAPNRKSFARLAISNVNLITLEHDAILADQNVIVEEGRIRSFGPADEIEIPASTERIDGQGKYLLPGLCDMHVHLAPGAGNDQDPAGRQMKMFLIHGITTVRGMMGMPDHVELRDRVARGEVSGPTIVCAGPPMMGGPIPMPEAAAEYVMKQSMVGFDIIKVHEGLSPESYQAIVEAAAKHKIPVAGHVTAKVGLKRALAAKQTSIEHLDSYLRESITGDGSIQVPTGQFLFGPALNHVQDSKLIDWARATKEAGVWNTPTLNLFETIVSGKSAAELAKRPEMKYVPAGQLGLFMKQMEGVSKIGATEADRAKFIELRRSLVRHLDRAGAGLLLGSDSPQFFLVEGAATHHELGNLVEAGLSPLKAILAATKNPGEYLGSIRGEKSDFGTIAVGKRADLVLVDNNPLENVANLRQISGVVVRGRWLSSADLQKLKEELEGQAQG